MLRRHKYNRFRLCHMVLLHEKLCSVFKVRLLQMTFIFVGIILYISEWDVDNGNNVLPERLLLEWFPDS